MAEIMKRLRNHTALFFGVAATVLCLHTSPASAQEAGTEEGIPTLKITNRPSGDFMPAAPMATPAMRPVMPQSTPISGGAAAPALPQSQLYNTPNRAPAVLPNTVLNENYFAPVETMASRKVVDIRDEMFGLQEGVASLSDRMARLESTSQDLAAAYYANVATISTQLQSGTTPGNPRLLERLSEAQEALEVLAGHVADLNTLAIEVSDTASIASFLQESARAAYSLNGSVEEDHIQLAQLEDQITNTIVVIERLLNNINDDITRSAAYLASERSNLRTLSLAIANGDLYGRSLANRPFSNVGPSATAAALAGQGGPITTNMPSTAMQAPGVMSPAQPRPLVVVKFNRPNVDYQQAVYVAINEALERYPNAQFELVAVNPTQGNAARVAIEKTKARRNAEKVLRTLTQMGLDSSRITLSSLANEAIQSNEVHLYIR